ncbi:Helicase conserved C-terminal domain-containing protein [[Clostridium] aminophilum]|uniref:Helicase conserved C-terminal domain-containing protein n=1 Tax=[Clostridium] aminophilum TaxID=1526 RepID=A0A1I0B0T4_9FIRM|nr:helicase-related protein [[Clostridium] aminophilum]SES99534.1 Helicase conserved C-terminal domain-containing protein [[Clostridium] aminophilum]
MAKEGVTGELDAIEKRIMSGLKDFQQATVNRIDYLYRHGQRRVLVSDEVGLGKTLIARGTVAKMARLRREEGDSLFKVVYICSNAAIADQNLRKLRITNEAKTESASRSRLSMQHLNIFRQENDAELIERYIQLIPLTPDTSFRMTSGAGIVDERALMYAILRRMPEFRRYLSELEVAMMNDAMGAWHAWCKGFYEHLAGECDQESGGRYFQYMTDKLRIELSSVWIEDKTYFDGIKDLCRAIRRNGGERVGNNKIIGQLRVIFAKISLEKLEPDLVIMDEFQRFKYLLNSDPDSETGMLANKFFHSDDVRMLLLSATPYKMYSTPEEIDEARIDEHYTEFLSVMDFLNEESDAGNEFLTVWKDYSVKLKEMTRGDTTILAAKDAAEEAMYQTVCRTERISAKENADIIDDSDVHLPLEVLEQDIRSYVQAQELLDAIGANYHVPVDYIKSTPYLMSFMRDYQLKRNVEKYFKSHPLEVHKIKKDCFWLNRNALDRYDKIPNNNARLERVMDTVLQRGVEKLLWMPPSKPYYEMQGVFKDTEKSTKTLIFSSWEMVPRMIASLISYEAERRTVGKLAKDYHDRDAHYFYSGEKRYPSARMNFSVSNGTPSAMTLFCLLYPSKFLSDCYDPIECMNAGMNIREIQRDVKAKIAEKLKGYPGSNRGTPDKRWYYIAPLLMDDAEYAYHWIDSGDKLADYDDGDEKSKKQKGFKAHLEMLRDLFYESHSNQFANLGKRPDDLIDVLTDMAIASPAICIHRAYRRYLKEDEVMPSYMPSHLARVFINRMNSAESTAVVELACGRKSEDAHWKNLLTYCRQGNLQAVFDEYAHLISNGLDHDEALVAQLHRQMMEAMDIRTTQYNVDTYKSFQKRMLGQKDRPTNIRTHFAVAFTKGDGKETDTDRKKTIRNAFNSPFRPFVLATTSIGQEGLDFHNYCRRIVHWNLPSNPIDLEQREGRINRFECLAIRQNVAQRYGRIHFKNDVWNEMFEEASRVEKTEGSSDLIPYWGLRESEDMVKIERIVPMYPFSRDGLAYERLIKILSMYRLTLGQARQEELLEYLFRNCDDPEKLKELFINLSPFYKEQRGKS